MSLARDTIATLGTRSIGLALGFVASIVAARALGPEGRGFLATALTVGATGAQIANLGLHAGNTLTISTRRADVGAVLGNSLAICGGLAVVALVIGGSLIGRGPVLLNLPGALGAAALLLIPLGLASQLTQTLLVAIERVATSNLVELLARGTIVFGMLGAVGLGVVSPLTFAIVTLLAFALTTVVSTIRIVAAEGTAVRVDGRLLVGQLPYGLRVYAAGLLSFLVLRVDLLLVQAMRGPTDAGQYSIAVALADIVILPAVTAGSLLFPRLTREPDPAERRRLALTTARATAVVMTGAAVLAAVLAEPAIRLLYGTAYEPCVPAFIWLMPGIGILAVETIFMNYFAAQAMPRIAIAAPAAALTINILLNVLAIPAFGIVGASFASTVAYAVMFVVVAAAFVREPAGRASR